MQTGRLDSILGLGEPQVHVQSCRPSVSFRAWMASIVSFVSVGGVGGVKMMGRGSVASGSSDGTLLLMSMAYRIADSFASWSSVIVPAL